MSKGKADVFVTFVLQKTYEYFANAFSTQNLNVVIAPEVFEQGWRAAIAALPKANKTFTQAFTQHLFTRLSDTTSALFQEDPSPESHTVFKDWVLREFSVVHEPGSPVVKDHIVALFSGEPARKLLIQLQQDNNSTRALLALYSLGGLFSDTNLIQFLISNCSDCVVTATTVQDDAENCDDEVDDAVDYDDAQDDDSKEVSTRIRTHADAVMFFQDIVPDISAKLTKADSRRVFNLNLDEARTVVRLLRVASKGAPTSSRVSWMNLAAQKLVLKNLKTVFDVFVVGGRPLSFLAKTIKYVEGFQDTS